MSLNRTALYPEHRRLGAKLVDFAGWEMPIQYGSQLDEHHAVRGDAGMFDVSHMRAVDLRGARVVGFLRRLLANDVAKLTSPGRALYTCLCNEHGGVIDDLIVYRLAADRFRVVVNAGTTDKDLAWFHRHAAEFAVAVQPRSDLGILAVQGPQARQRVAARLPADLAARALSLRPFAAAWDDRIFVARTGYTGEDGFELMLPEPELVTLWRDLFSDGVKPCGLGARDTLRLEAGLNLYGQDMDETVSPLECGLGWTVAWAGAGGQPPDRDDGHGDAGRSFIGREALEAQRSAPPRRQVGVVLEQRGVLRAHMPVRCGQRPVGELTSGGFAPTMKVSIALARVASGADGPLEVEIRGRWWPVRRVKPPFVRHGEVLV